MQQQQKAGAVQCFSLMEGKQAAPTTRWLAASSQPFCLWRASRSEAVDPVARTAPMEIPRGELGKNVP